MLDAIKITSKFKAVPPGFPAIKPSFNDYTWAEIKQISDAELWDFYGFEVGDKKAVNVNYGGASGEVYCFITDFNHNYKLEGKGISLEFGLKDGRHVTMGDASLSGDDWERSSIRTECTNFFNALPSDLQAVIKEVTKYSNNRISTSIEAIAATKEKIFIPDIFEIVRTIPSLTSYYNFFAADFQTQYRFYQSANTTIKFKRISPYGDATNYGLRSMTTYRNERAIIMSSGELGTDSTSAGLAFMFVV